MIKAEIISHEGNPGPNWLDRCRTVATPVNVTAVLLLIVIGGLFIGILHKDRTTAANQQSTSPTGQASVQPENTSLQVESLQQKTTTNNGNTSVQSAAGGNAPVANTNADTKSSDVLGATKTPALNNSNTSSSQYRQGSNNLKKTVDNLQSTVQNTTQQVNNALNGLTSGLGL